MEYNYNNASMSLSANPKSGSVLGQFQLIVLFINAHALWLLCIPGKLCMPDIVNLILLNIGYFCIPIILSHCSDMQLSYMEIV